MLERVQCVVLVQTELSMFTSPQITMSRPFGSFLSFLCHPPLHLISMFTSKWLTMNSFFPAVLTLFLVSVLSTTLNQCSHQIT